jgi:hypothetical protein
LLAALLAALLALLAAAQAFPLKNTTKAIYSITKHQLEYL